MEDSIWAKDNPIQPVLDARQTAANANASGSSSQRPQLNSDIFQKPDPQPVRMATPATNPGPVLHNPALAMQMSGVNSNMTRANSKAVPRSRATAPSANTFSQPPPRRTDSAVSFQPAPFTSKTNNHEDRQPALPQSSQPTQATTIDKPKSASTTTSAAPAMPSRFSYAPHNRNQNENERLTLRDSSPDGEQWRTEDGNKFKPFLDHVDTYDRKGRPYTAEDENMLLDHSGTRDSLNRFNEEGTREANQYEDRGAPHNFQATLRYEDEAEPVPRPAPVRITAPSTNTAIKAAQAEMMKENARLEKEIERKKQKEQEEKDAKLARETEEREAMEDAARVAEEQEEAERKAELNRQHYEVEVHNTTPTATSTEPSMPESVPQQADVNVRLDAVLDRLAELNDRKAKIEDYIKRAQDRLVAEDGEVRALFAQLSLLRREQAVKDKLKSAK